MKSYRIIAIFLCLVFCVFSVSCKKSLTAEERWEIINGIEPEVDYEFSTYTTEYLIKDGQYYNFQKLAEKELGYECVLYPYQNVIFGDNVYFLYQYGEHGEIRRIDGISYNYMSFDVALVKVNLTDATCEIVHKFENIYPTSNFEYVNPLFLLIIDSDRAVIQYNGYIQILDLNHNVIRESIKVYNVDEYRFDMYQQFNFDYNSYGDYYVKNGDTLDYYELDGYKFKHHQYKINTNTFWVERYKNYVYTSNLFKEKVYYDAYDLETDASYDVNELVAMIKENTVSYEAKPDIIGGKPYYLYYVSGGTLNGGEIIIKDLDKKTIVTIDEKYMIENSEIFKQINGVMYYDHGYASCAVVDGKLFLGFYSHNWSRLAKSPLYIFEYDIENNSIKYAGYLDKATKLGYLSIVK